MTNGQRFPSLAPDHSDEDDHFFRCPNCGELFAVGTWLKDGYLIECDASPCLGQFYAKLTPPEPPVGASGQSTASEGAESRSDATVRGQSGVP